MSLLYLAAAAARDTDRPTIFLVVGVVALALLIWGLVKRLLVLALIFAGIAAAAWYFYFA